MEIAIPLYDRFTALDAVGPYQVLSALPEARVRFIAAEAGPVRADNRMLTLVAEASLDDVPSPDILVVPGGIGTRQLLEDEQMVGWVKTAHETSQYTTSVCTGSLLLAAAGILDGVDATTHWMVRDFLGELGANPVPDRVVERGKVRDRRGRVVRDRHGAGAGRANRRAGGVAGDPARHRVRPRASPRRGLAREGPEGDRGAGRRRDGADGIGGRLGLESRLGMPKRDPRMIPLGYGKFVRADRVYALVPLEGDERRDGRRTYVHVDGLAEPIAASRSERAILADVETALAEAAGLPRRKDQLASAER